MSCHRRMRGRFTCSPSVAQSAPKNGVPSSHSGSVPARRAMLSGARTHRPGKSHMQRRRRIAPKASAATDAPLVAERLVGADAEQWSAAVEEVTNDSCTGVAASRSPHVSAAAVLSREIALSFAGHPKKILQQPA